MSIAFPLKSTYAESNCNRISPPRRSAQVRTILLWTINVSIRSHAPLPTVPAVASFCWECWESAEWQPLGPRLMTQCRPSAVQRHLRHHTDARAGRPGTDRHAFALVTPRKQCGPDCCTKGVISPALPATANAATRPAVSVPATARGGLLSDQQPAWRTSSARRGLRRRLVLFPAE